ncbi:Helix-turn-helix domain-containing protein [Lachnospiraceae bacterium C10]|nr:Helix-turn-helix domain-containing protein [Lachnospiraceae bacterium C10]
MKGYMTIKQASEVWGVTPRRIQVLCAGGRIEGAMKFGRDWAIPKDATKPNDKRR